MKKIFCIFFIFIVLAIVILILKEKDLIYRNNSNNKIVVSETPKSDSVSNIINKELNSSQKYTYTDSFNNLFHKSIDTIITIQGETFRLKDISELFDFFVSKTDSNIHINEFGNNYSYWKHFLTKPHPTVETMQKFFKEASEEFDVPKSILHAIGKLESNWTQIGPTIDQGWGVMHLVQNNYCQTLDEASNLLNLSPIILKEDARQNIRGAAALLAKYAGSGYRKFTSYEEWLPALEKFSGLINIELQRLQALEYLNIIYNGSLSITLWGDTIKLNPQLKYSRNE